MNELNTIYRGDAKEVLRGFPESSIDCCVTSPPYWSLRDYMAEGQIGLESTPEEYIKNLVEVFREVKRALKDDGTLWINIGDSFFGGGYSNHRINGDEWRREMNGDKRRSRQQDLIKANPQLKPKDLVGIPWMLAFALRADGWFLRSDIIWAKPNHMPESVKDRPTKSHEYIFLLTKSNKYYYDSEAIKEPSITDSAVKRNKRTVWNIQVRPFKGAHFATYPIELIEPCILAGTMEGGTVLDPFFGSGTTGIAALRNDRNFVGVEINEDYANIAEQRIREELQ